MENSTKQLYIVLSQTGTVLSRILKILTRAKYNHASISTTDDLEQMYSFGRKKPYNPFWGGFVKESPSTGTFKRFSNTKALILSVNISEEKYAEIQKSLHNMYSKREIYGYNYLGLCLAAFHITHRGHKRYYCSEFVRDVLIKGDVEGAEFLPPIAKPIDFLEIPHREVYEGYLKEYSKGETVR